MVRYARKVLKIRELSPFVLKFPVEFVPVFQKDLGWPNMYHLPPFFKATYICLIKRVPYLNVGEVSSGGGGGGVRGLCTRSHGLGSP